MQYRLNSEEAKSLLDQYVRSWDRLKSKSSSGMPQKRRPIRYARPGVWRQPLAKNCTLWAMSRSKGQLLAYLELAGGSIPARGIPCMDGRYIRPDKQVMTSFLHHGDLSFVEAGDDGYFQLTDCGRKYLNLVPQDED